MAEDEEKAEQVATEEPGKLKGGAESREEPEGPRLYIMSLVALGVVYGDIGTSPLYAIRKCFSGEGSVIATEANVLGVASLVLWSLIVVISLKYIVYVMRASNEGEGGILALMALAQSANRGGRFQRKVILALGLFGSALLYGDGMITPAISVLSAVEGIEVATSATAPYVVPITVAILAALFILQARGTEKVGRLFGPIMLVWFAVLAVLGITGIVHEPSILRAVSPTYAARFLLTGGIVGFLVLGAVFLVVTGGEALYADIGHLGRRAIRITWFALVLPALVLNYFGQSARLLASPQMAYGSLFYESAPRWALYPLVLLATMATIIASQAIITASYSLTRQAVMLGHLPRVTVVHTSKETAGQIYIPAVNWALMFATIGLVLAFRSSGNLAAAYGLAVSTTMVITTVLMYFVAVDRWEWSRPAAIALTAALLAVDVPFLGANAFKFVQGGWFPLLVAGLVCVVMNAWRYGRSRIMHAADEEEESINKLLEEIDEKKPARVAGTGVFLSGRPRGAPAVLVRQLRFNHALPERAILLTVEIEDVPRVPRRDRVEHKELSHGISRVVLRYGFLENPDVPAVLARLDEKDFKIDVEKVIYYVGHVWMIPEERRWPLGWRSRLFALMARNSARPVQFFGLPSEQVFELGVQVTL